MRRDRRLVAAMLAPGAALALWLAAGALLLGAAMPPAARADLAPLLASHGALVLGWWAVAAAIGAAVVHRLHRAHVAAPARLVDATRLLAGDPAAPDLVPPAGPAGALADAINALAAERRRVAADAARLADEASRKIAHERDQLAALMAELDQAVLVCTLDGRILLYNARARALFRRVSAEGADPVGLGRPIQAVLDRTLIDHALDTVARQGARQGARGAAGAPARLVAATPDGHLLGVGLAPVRPTGGPDAAAGADPTGYVLLVDDITDAQAAQGRRDAALLALTEASRASLASMQAALDMLDYPDLAAADRDRFQAIVRDEVQGLAARLDRVAAEASHDMLTRWPLQDMLGADLAAAAARQIGDVAVDAVDPDLWLSVDSFGLARALGFLAERLDRPGLRLRLAAAGPRAAHLDLAWPDDGPPAAAAWQDAPMQAGGAPAPLSPRDVAERHGGALWLGHDRAAGLSFFRFLLPLATGAPAEAALAERPEFYDFDLFAAGGGDSALDERRLADLAFTVFDTETTGLDPAGGDEILQLGAVRIVNGRLLSAERFDRLVDPGRSIPEASIPFHGITPEMVRGQPTIGEVLPAFHAFAADSVLVGHNVAFDLRFLQLKEAATGLRFAQPVLDTLLLASVAQPNEPSHSLEAIAERLGLAVTGRHSAAGDALTTARVFLKLWPLLAAKGIVTLGEARAAAEASWYARLRY